MFRQKSKRIRSGRPKAKQFLRALLAAFALAIVPLFLFCPAGGHAQSSGSNSALVIPAATASGIGLASAAVYQVSHDSQWRDYEDVIVLAVLDETAKSAANSRLPVAIPDYTKLIKQLRTVLDSNPPQSPTLPDEAACLRYALDTLVNPNSGSGLLSNPASPLLPAVVANLENRKFTILETYLSRNTSRQYPAELALPSIAVAAYEFVGDYVREASDLANNDPEFAAAVNPVLLDLIGLDSTAAYSAVQNLYPSAVPSLPPPAGDGSFTLNYQDLITQYKSIIAGVQSAIDGHLLSIEAGPNGSDVISGASRPRSTKSSHPFSQGTAGSSPSCTAGTTTAGAIILSADQCTGAKNTTTDSWSQAQSTITGLSKIIGHFDSQAGTQISAAGSAMIQAGKAVAQIDNLISSGLSIGNLALGLADPVGALVGAGAQIFSSLFSSSPSSDANAAVVAQINRLSDQISRLQTDVDNQFKQVDATLSTILTTLAQGLANLNGDLHAIEAGLLDIQAQLSQMELYSQVWAQTQEYETLIGYLNGCLDYRSVHPGTPDIGNDLYNQCENNFFTWANNNVTDQLWAGVQQPDYSDAAIYNTFLNSSVTGVCSGCASPFSTLVNYMAQFSSQNLGVSPLSPPTTRLPNPEMWKLVVRAYLQLAREWPQYTVNISSSSIADLIQVGENLQSAIRNANSINNNASSPNQALFTALVNKYNDKVGAVKQAVSLFESSQFVPNNTCTSGAYSNCIPPNVNLWSKSAETVSYTPPISGINVCDGGPALNLSVPAGIYYAVPPALLLADQRSGQNLIGLCFEAHFTDTDQGPNIKGVSMTIRVTYGGVPVLSMTAQAGHDGVEWLVCLTCGDAEPVYWFFEPSTGQVQQGWEVSVKKGQFEDHSQVSLSVQPWAQSLYSTLQTEETSFYSQVGQQFVDPVGAGVAIQRAAQDLSGIKAMLTAYANFGLPTYLETNNALRSQLYGTAGILDGGAVQQVYAAAGQMGIPQNPELDLTTSTNPPISVLTQTIGGILGQINQAQIPDSSKEIDTILADLQAFRSLENASGTDGSGHPTGALSFCHYLLSPASGTIDSAGGTASVAVAVIAGGNCNWTASTHAPWLTVTAGQMGSANGTVRITASPNVAASARGGIVIIGDQVLRVIQSAGLFPTAQYTLSGRVTDASGNGVGNATLTLSGTQSGTTTSGPDGSYQFTGLPTGNYTITPSSGGYTFNPPSQNVTGLNSNQTLNFVAQLVPPALYSLSGRVIDASGAGIAGVALALSSSPLQTAISAVDGSFTFTSVPAGNYTLTPSMLNYVFSPSQSSVAVNGNQFLMFVGTLSQPPTGGQSFADSFEATSFDPFWTVMQQFGTVTLSGEQAHSGAQSAKFASISGGQRYMWLQHVFPAPTKGTASVWFYDVAPGQETLYEKLLVYNSTQPSISSGVGTQDFDAFCYAANFGSGGPNGTCGIYPQASTTNIQRTPGWHQLSISFSANAVTLAIDGNVVFTTAGDYSFDTIQLSASGPYWRPNTTAYFDDFSFQPLASTPTAQYTLSGHAKDSSGKGVGGSTVGLSGAHSATITTFATALGCRLCLINPDQVYQSGLKRQGRSAGEGTAERGLQGGSCSRRTGAVPVAFVTSLVAYLRHGSDSHKRLSPSIILSAVEAATTSGLAPSMLGRELVVPLAGEGWAGSLRT